MAATTTEEEPVDTSGVDALAEQMNAINLQLMQTAIDYKAQTAGNKLAADLAKNG